MQHRHRPIAKARAGLADRLFVYGCTAVYMLLVGAVLAALRLWGT